MDGAAAYRAPGAIRGMNDGRGCVRYGPFDAFPQNDTVM